MTIGGQSTRNAAAVLYGSIAWLAVILLSACSHALPAPAPSPLPAHPAWEMFPRASSPPPGCPGQYRSVLAQADGDTFLGCWGQKTD
jgi:hypothetical protein